MRRFSLNMLASLFIVGLSLAPQGAQPAAEVRITLSWNSTADLDLRVVDPWGELIYFDNPKSKSEGALNQDANRCARSPSAPASETIVWPTGRAPAGIYQVFVDYFEECRREGLVEFRVTAIIDGQSQEFQGRIAPGERLKVAELVRGEAILDSQGRVTGTPENPLPQAETPQVVVTGLKPAGGFKIEVIRLRDGTIVSEVPQVTADFFGILQIIFWWDPGFDREGNFRPDLAAGDYEVRISGEGITKRVKMKVAERPQPTLFFADAAGKLLTGVAVGSPVYARGTNLPPNTEFPVYICRDRRIWPLGFSFSRCTGMPLTVELRWEAAVDLDLQVKDPLGNVADPLVRRVTPIDGRLEKDKLVGPATERFLLMEAPSGDYSISVRYHRGSGEVPYTLLVTLGKETKEFRGKLSRPGEVSTPIKITNPAGPLRTIIRTDSRGELAPVVVWKEASLGEWDLIADLDRSGTFTEKDLAWQLEQTGLVVSQSQTLASLASAGLGVDLFEDMASTMASTKDKKHKKIFWRGEPIYAWGNPLVAGSGRPDKIALYVVKYPDNVQPGRGLIDITERSEIIVPRPGCTNAPPTLLAPKGLEPGKYAVVLDWNINGVYDPGIDLVDPFEVLPLYAGGSISPLQSQLDAAKDGDEIVIRPEKPFDGTLIIKEGKRITLRADGKVPLCGKGQNPAILVQKDAELVLEGEFTICGEADGIVAEGAAKVSLQGDRITATGEELRPVISGNAGWGIIFTRSAGTIQKLIIQGNKKGGILLRDDSFASILDSQIKDNKGDPGDGIRLERLVNVAPSVIDGNIISGHNGCGIRKDASSKRPEGAGGEGVSQVNNFADNTQDICF
jgi:uncharacterized protein YfaP (DUF2135 family)